MYNCILLILYMHCILSGCDNWLMKLLLVWCCWTIWSIFFTSGLHGVTSIFQFLMMEPCHRISCVSWKSMQMLPLIFIVICRYYQENLTRCYSLHHCQAQIILLYCIVFVIHQWHPYVLPSNMVPWTYLSQHPKRHISRLSCCKECSLMWPTHKQTSRATSRRIWCGLIMACFKNVF